MPAVNLLYNPGLGKTALYAVRPFRHSDLTMTMTMDDEEPIHVIEENDQAPIVSAGEFLKLPFVTDDE